ncbi:MAG: ATP-binding protein [Bryobacterales bacterium]|nr:ATP-binding protein [Bryobacterales bacterium]
MTVEAPTGRFPATRAGCAVSDKAFEIRVADNGIGMTPQQVRDFFLVVGAERRNDRNRGDMSPRLRRKVVGRRGVGKLAPFGICKAIEVISAGGAPVSENGAASGPAGYLASHITLHCDGIVELGDEPDERCRPTLGDRDDSHSPASGTRIILKDFNCRKVPRIDVLGRRLAQRLGIRSDDWNVRIRDNTRCGPPLETVGEFHIDAMPDTRLAFLPGGSVLGPDGSLEDGPASGFEHDGRFHPRRWLDGLLEGSVQGSTHGRCRNLLP